MHALQLENINLKERLSILARSSAAAFVAEFAETRVVAQSESVLAQQVAEIQSPTAPVLEPDLPDAAFDLWLSGGRRLMKAPEPDRKPVQSPILQPQGPKCFSRSNADDNLPPMIATAFSDHIDTLAAVQAAADDLYTKLSGQVDLVFLSATESHSLAAVQAATADVFKAVNLAGNTSHGGLLTQAESSPRQLFGGSALGLWGIRDVKGSFAVAAATIAAAAADGEGDADCVAEAAGKAAAEMIRQQLEAECAAAVSGDTDGHGRSDTLCWVLARPGAEDAIIRGVRGGCRPRRLAAPDSTTIFGTSSADAQFWQFACSPKIAAEATGSGFHGFSSGAEDGVVLIAMRPSIDFTPVYAHAYSPTIHCGVVSDGNGKRLIRRLRAMPNAPDEPAADVYNRWCGGFFSEQLEDAKTKGISVDILAKSANFPLCREALASAQHSKVEQSDTEPEAEVVRTVSLAAAATTTPTVLLHPAEIHADGSLSLYAESPVEGAVRLLCGTPAGLIREIAVTGDALDDRAPFSRESILGALFFFCGGTMDAVLDGGATRREDAADSVRSAFARACGVDKPFLVAHPFGEQCFQIGWQAPVHANLMFGGVVFGRATYGLQQRGRIFLSYNWGKENKTQIEKVLPLKSFLESNTRLKCWLDLERLGPGCDLDHEMNQGVERADVFICCLTDRYLQSVNCCRELSFAKQHEKFIVPLLLDDYTQSWPPTKAAWADVGLETAFASDTLYVKWQTEKDISDNSAQLVNKIDEEVRRLVQAAN